MELQKKVTKHISLKELQQLLKKESNKHIYQHLLFIHQLYLEEGVEKACKRMCLSKRIGYLWLEQWNAKGYKGLIPNFGGGRPPRLNEDKKEQLKETLNSKDNWLTSEVRDLIKREFKISYSLRQVSRILKGFKMHYSKPYPEDYRKPENAKGILENRLKDALKGNKKDFVLGFIDEASPQTTDNKQRFWSFKKSKIIKNTTKYKANTFGFYPINGKSVLDFKENSKKESVCGFLRKIRDKNPIKTIIAVLDNFSSHKAEETRRYAKSLGIRLVFLPPYSPNLNPIEQIWRCVRRKISQIFVKSLHSFTETIKSAFYLFAKRKSFMLWWVKTFLPDLFKKL